MLDRFYELIQYLFDVHFEGVELYAIGQQIMKVISQSREKTAQICNNPAVSQERKENLMIFVHLHIFLARRLRAGVSSRILQPCICPLFHLGLFEYQLHEIDNLSHSERIVAGYLNVSLLRYFKIYQGIISSQDNGNGGAYLTASTALANIFQICARFSEPGSKGQIQSTELQNILTLAVAYARQWGLLQHKSYICQYLRACELTPMIDQALAPFFDHIAENEAQYLMKIPLLIQQHSKPIKRALFLLLGYYICKDMGSEKSELERILGHDFLAWRRNINYGFMQVVHQFENDKLVKTIFERIIYFSGPVSVGDHEVEIYEPQTLRMSSAYFNINMFEARVEEVIKDCCTLYPQHYFLTKMTEQALTEEIQSIAKRKFIQSQQNQLCKDILPILFPLQPPPSAERTVNQLGTEEAKNVTLIAILHLLICKIQPAQEQEQEGVMLRSNYLKILLPLAGRCAEFARAITPLIILRYAGSDPRMMNDYKSSSSTGSSFSDRNLIPLTFSAAERSKDPAVAEALGEAFLFLNRLHFNVNKKIAPYFRRQDKLRKMELPVLTKLVKGKDEHVNALVFQSYSNRDFKELVSFTQALAILIDLIPLESVIRGSTTLPDKSLTVVLLEYKHFQRRATPSDTNLLEQIRQIDEANSSNSGLKSVYFQSYPPQTELPPMTDLNGECSSQFSTAKLDRSLITVPKHIQMVQEYKEPSKLTQMSISRDYMSHPFPHYPNTYLSQSSDGFPVNPYPSFLPQPKPLTIFQRLNELKDTQFSLSSGLSIPYVLNQKEALEKKPAFSRILDLLTQIMFLVGSLIRQKDSEHYLADLQVCHSIQSTIRKYADLVLEWLCRSFIQPERQLYRLFMTVLYKILHITNNLSQILAERGKDSKYYDGNMYEFDQPLLHELMAPDVLCSHIEKLMIGLQECEQSFDVLYFLNTCYFLLFKALDRKQEAAIFLRELIRQHLKHRDQIPMFHTATQDLIPFQEYMIEFKLYQAIIIKQTGLVNDVLGVLTDETLKEIKLVEERVRRCADSLQPYLQYYFDRDIYLRCSLLRLEVLSRSYYKDKDKIFTNELYHSLQTWPEFNFFYARILDEVHEINSPLADVDLLNRKDRQELNNRPQSEQCPPLDKLKLKIRLYVQACNGDDRYIMSGLGRALQIYFDTLLHPQFWNFVTHAEQIADNWIRLFDQVAIYKYCPLVPQLLYRLNQLDAFYKVAQKEGLRASAIELWKKPLLTILSRILNEYPNQNLWWFMSLLLRDFKPEAEILNPEKLKRMKPSSQCEIAESILLKLKKESKQIVVNAMPFFRALLTFSMKLYKDERCEVPAWLQNCRNTRVLMPCDEFIQPRLSTGAQSAKERGVPLNLRETIYPPEEELVYITKVDPYFSVIRSKECPKKFSMVGSNKKKYDFLLKGRVNATSNQKVAMSFIRACNTILSEDADAVRYNLNMKCFSIVPVGASGMIIEWVRGLTSLKEKIVQSAQAEGLRVEFSDIRMVVNDKQIRQYLGEKWEAVMRVTPPSLHNFLFLDFEEPKQFRKAMITWTKQLSCWSYVGYFLGFGDRHCDNILIDPKTAELMHVDFECVMDKGTTLPIPEIVPFRMTKNIASPLGAASFNGLFKETALTVIKVIRRNAAMLATIINTFKGTEFKEEVGHDSKGVMIACKRLLGKDAPMDMKDHTAAMVPFSEEEQFKNAIMVATSPLNLRKMYTGWMPWL